MQIRKEQPADIQAIFNLHYAAFKNHPMHVPGSEPTEPQIITQLRATHALSLSLVAEKQNSLVAHIAFSPVELTPQQQGWFLLGPVGVLPQNQGQGIGSTLIRRALQQMQDQGAQGIVLVGEAHFYSRFGFESSPTLLYEGVPNQYVLGLAFGEQRPEGTIVPHPAFTQHA